MDKRLIKLLQTRGNEIRGGQMLDTYNQQIQEEVSCTIRTNVNTANHHFIVMEAKIIKEGNYSPSGHNASSIVSAQGIAPAVMENHGTVTAIKEPQVINPLKGKSDNGWHFEQQVYDAEGIARAVKAGEGRGNIPKVIVYDDYNQNIPKNQSVIGTITTNIGNSAPRHGIKLIEVFDPLSVAMRGRNPDNPSERGKSNGNYKQRLEMNESGVVNTITSVQKDSMVAEPKRIGNIYPSQGQNGNVYDANGVSPTISSGQGVTGNGIGSCNAPKVAEPKIVEDWQTVVGNKQLNPFRGSVEGTSPCITSACGAGGGMTPMLTDADLETTKTKEFIEQVRGHEEMRYRIRKLTPRECFRLMGVDDDDIDKIQASGISNSQQYKLAGNSIVVDVLYHIFRKMFVETENENQQLCLF